MLIFDSEEYNVAKDLFLQGFSLRQISIKLNINRKKLSLLLQQDGFYTKKETSPAKVEEIISRYNEGENITSIAKNIGIDRHVISRILKDKKIRTPLNRKRKYKYLDSEILILYNVYQYSANIIADLLDISAEAVSICLRKYNYINKHSTQKYNYNTQAFLSIDTEAEAYWLGFLYADGYINQYGTELELSLQYQDKHHIQKLLNFLRDGKIKHKIVKNHPQAITRISNKEIVQNLINNGCINNKTNQLKYPEGIIPTRLIHHFIRGYFDADGNAYFNRDKNIFIFNIIGASYNMMKSLNEKLISCSEIENKDLIIKKRRKENYLDLYLISFSKKSEIKKIYKFLYQDATIYLERKKDKFDQYLKNNIL